MKQKHFIMTIAAAVLFAVGCNDKESVWSSAVDDMDVRLTNLEKLCAEANTNITALQTIINAQADGDVIKTVTEIKSDGKVVGYTITFGKNDPITIYNGKDGNDGEAPVIGVKKHTDNVYYWTLNGEWLLDNGEMLRVTGNSGADGVSPQLKIENGYWMISYDSGSTWTQAGKATGDNGQNGNTPQLKIENGYWMISYNNGSTWTQLSKATGDNGNNGITPQLKIENGYWMISYDNGSTWTQAGKATGDNGQNGDSIFLSVTQDENNVYFTLADGTVITISKNTAGAGDGGTGENGSGDGGDSDEIGDVYNDGVYNGYAYVDLGLPSGLKWATCNVGATHSWDVGDLFAWGETVGKGKSDPSNVHNLSYMAYFGGGAEKIYYDWATYKWCSGTTANTLNKYNYSSAYGSVVDNSHLLNWADDAAYANMGGSWKMPTDEQQKELIDNCYCEWTDSYNGKDVAGCIVYKVKNANDKGKKKYSGGTVTIVGAYSLMDAHIFFPANKYWSSKNPQVGDQNVAYILTVSSNDVSSGRRASRCIGYPVRGVYK